MHFILTIVFNAVAIWLGAQVLKGVQVTDFPRALIIGLVVSLLNATIGAMLHWVSTPINWLTLGLFSFVVDALILMVADYFLKGLKIQSFWWAVALAVIVSVINTVAHWMFHF